MKKLRKLLKYTIFAIIALVVLGIIYMNTIFKTAIEEVGTESVGTEVSVGYATLSPLSGNLTLGGIEVGNVTGYNSPFAVKLGGVSVTVDNESVTEDVIHVKEIVIDNPVISYEPKGRGNNLSDLVRQISRGSSSSSSSSSGESNQKAEETAEQKVVIDHVYINDGEVQLAAGFMGVTAGGSIDLPNLHLTDIGKRSGGTEIADVVELLLKELNKNMGKADLGSLTKGLVKDVKGNIKEMGKEKLKGLFK